MNTKMNSIIETYLESQNMSDYAIMINGKWGCGKTYYVANELKKIIEDKKMKYIYISLNGCDNFIKVINKITLRLIFKNNFALIDDDLIDNLYGLGVGLSELHPVAKIIYNIKNVVTKPIVEKTISEIKPSEIAIIFDDIERVSNDILRNDFIGLIYESYTKKGYKTIIVGDETNISDVKYDKIKEKVIRRTISYEPDKKLQIENFFDNQFSNPKYKKYLDKTKDKLINYIIKANVFNLRTISFIIDNFIIVLDKLNDEIKIRFDDFIFKNILLLTNEYKNGKITITDIDKINMLMNYPNAYYMNIALRNRGSEIEKTYLDDFHDRYLSIPLFSDFRPIGELLNFILTGYLDKNKLEKEIKSLFLDEFIPESEKVSNFLTHNLAVIEEDDLIREFDKFISYLEKGDYYLFKLPYIYTFLKFIQKSNFIADWHYDIEKSVSIALRETIKNNDMILDEVDYFTLRQKYSEIEMSEDFYNKLCENIIEQSNNKKDESIKDRINKIFKLIISNDQTYYELLYSNNNFFQDIVKTGAEQLFFNLSNKGIRIIETYLYNNIQRISNAGIVSYNEKPALEQIIIFMESYMNIYSKDFNHFRNVRIRELIGSMKNAVVHLEETQNR